MGSPNGPSVLQDTKTVKLVLVGKICGPYFSDTVRIWNEPSKDGPLITIKPVHIRLANVEYFLDMEQASARA